MNEGRSARASTCCVALLWWCTWSNSHTVPSKLQRPNRCTRPRLLFFVLFWLSFFRLKLVLFFSFPYFCFVFDPIEKQAFNALPIPDTPTAWSTNSINDSFLRTWPQTTTRKNDCISNFSIPRHHESLEVKKRKKNKRRIANFDTINYSEGGHKAAKRNGSEKGRQQRRTSWQKKVNQPLDKLHWSNCPSDW